MDAIRVGYKLPLKIEPARTFMSNNKSAITHSEFVNGAITELLESRRISEVDMADTHVVNPLIVSVQPSGKKRLIFDLSVKKSSLSFLVVTTINLFTHAFV